VALADDLQHLVDIAYLHRFRGRRIGRAAVVVSVSGASGALFADALTLNIADAGALREAFDDILRKARLHAPQACLHGVSVQPQVMEGVELLLGATRDPVFG